MNAAAEAALPVAQKAAQLFSERGFENARLEAELLLAHVLGIKRLDLYLQFDRPLTQSQLESFRTVVRRRLRHEPLQYIVGRMPFRELTLNVDRRALIPRPETEVLVGEVVRWARARADVHDALDIGTGSGAIALSLLQENACQRVVATDVSAESLALARENARAWGFSDRVEFRQGSLWSVIDDDEPFDIVVSNPPYIAEHERPTLPPEVRDWEPASALFGGTDGLTVIRELVSRAAAHLNSSGLLALEIGAGQAEAVSALISGTGAFEPASVLRDLAQRERIITAVKRV